MVAFCEHRSSYNKQWLSLLLGVAVFTSAAEIPTNSTSKEFLQQRLISVGPPMSLLQTGSEVSLHVTRHGHLVRDPVVNRDRVLQGAAAQYQDARILQDAGEMQGAAARQNARILQDAGEMQGDAARQDARISEEAGEARGALGEEDTAKLAEDTAKLAEALRQKQAKLQAAALNQVGMHSAHRDRQRSMQQNLEGGSVAGGAADDAEQVAAARSGVNEGQYQQHMENAGSGIDPDAAELARALQNVQQPPEAWGEQHVPIIPKDDPNKSPEMRRVVGLLENTKNQAYMKAYQDEMKAQREKVMEDSWRQYRERFGDSVAAAEAGRQDAEQAARDYVYNPKQNDDQALGIPSTQAEGGQSWQPEDAKAYYFGNSDGDPGAASRNVRPRVYASNADQADAGSWTDWNDPSGTPEYAKWKEDKRRNVEEWRMRQARRHQAQKMQQQEQLQQAHQRLQQQEQQQPQEQLEQKQQQQLQQEQEPLQERTMQQKPATFHRQHQSPKERQQQQDTETAAGVGVQSQTSANMEEVTVPFGQKVAKMEEDMRHAKEEEQELRALVQAATGTPGARARRPLIALSLAGLAMFAVAAATSGRLAKVWTSGSEGLDEDPGSPVNARSPCSSGNGAESSTPAGMAANILMSAVPAMPTFPRHHVLQVLCLCWIFLMAAQNAFLMPDSLGVLLNAEYSLAFSSWFACICFALTVVSALTSRRFMKPWSQQWNCRLVLVITGVQPALAMFSLMLVDEASPMRLWPTSQLIALLAIRLALSTSFGFSSLVICMAQRATPSGELVQFGMQRACATVLGSGLGVFMAALGPAIAISAGTWADASSSSSRTPLLVASVLWVALGTAISVLVSDDTGCPLCHKAVPKTDGIADDVPEALAGCVKDEVEEPLPAQALAPRKLWLLACAVFCLRALLTSGLEVTMANIWATEFAFSAADVGLGLGACFLLGAFLAPLAIALRERGGTAAEVEVICVLAGFCACASLLLFGPLGGALGGGDTGVWLTFLAGALVLPSSFLFAGTVEGLAMCHAIKDSAYSQENLLTLSVIFQDLCARFLGPSMMHGLFAFGGQMVCALAHLGVAILLLAIACSVRSSILALCISHFTTVAAAGGGSDASCGSTASCLPRNSEPTSSSKAADLA